ncbi:MAG: DUF6134 family protein [Pseudomonadota bacterium]
MRQLFVGAIAVFAVFGATPVALATEAERPPAIWTPIGGEEIRFDVFRKGDKRFGTHVLRFERLEDGALKVVNDIDLKVRFGPIVPFRYRHDSVELWRDGALVSLDGETLKEGDELSVDAALNEKSMQVRGDGFEGAAPADIIPSSHWNIGQVYSDVILSSENGELMDIETENLGRETVALSDGSSIEATRYRLVADLTVDLWYDDQGRWVKCLFEARGQTVEYVLSALY